MCSLSLATILTFRVSSTIIALIHLQEPPRSRIWTSQLTRPSLSQPIGPIACSKNLLEWELAISCLDWIWTITFTIAKSLNQNLVQLGLEQTRVRLQQMISHWSCADLPKSAPILKWQMSKELSALIRIWHLSRYRVSEMSLLNLYSLRKRKASFLECWLQIERFSLHTSITRQFKHHNRQSLVYRQAQINNKITQRICIRVPLSTYNKNRLTPWIIQISALSSINHRWNSFRL